jgi:hypothetical protein
MKVPAKVLEIPFVPPPQPELVSPSMTNHYVSTTFQISLTYVRIFSKRPTDPNRSLGQILSHQVLNSSNSKAQPIHNRRVQIVIKSSEVAVKVVAV